jgi:hypothetical protein
VRESESLSGAAGGSQRYPILDALRFVLALWVAIGHYQNLLHFKAKISYTQTMLWFGVLAYFWGEAGSDAEVDRDDRVEPVRGVRVLRAGGTAVRPTGAKNQHHGDAANGGGRKTGADRRVKAGHFSTDVIVDRNSKAL